MAKELMPLADLVDEIHALRGTSPEVIASRLGYQRRSISRRLRRAQMHDLAALFEYPQGANQWNRPGSRG